MPLPLRLLPAQLGLGVDLDGNGLVPAAPPARRRAEGEPRGRGLASRQQPLPAAPARRAAPAPGSARNLVQSTATSRRVSTHAHPSAWAATVTRAASSIAVRRRSGTSKSTHPCPATGRRSVACSGYQGDHRVPSSKGGADDPSIMQRLSTQEHKAKATSEQQQFPHRGFHLRQYKFTICPTSRGPARTQWYAIISTFHFGS